MLVDPRGATIPLAFSVPQQSSIPIWRRRFFLFVQLSRRSVEGSIHLVPDTRRPGPARASMAAVFKENMACLLFLLPYLALQFEKHLLPPKVPNRKQG